MINESVSFDRPMRPCAVKTCAELADIGKGYCDKHYIEKMREHKRKYQKYQKYRGQGLYHTHKWKMLRKKVLLKHPVCELCNEAKGEEVDHVQPWTTEAEFYDEENLQSLCKSCHSKKTAHERRMKKKGRGV